MPTTTWDANNKGGGLALSGSNQIATAGGGSFFTVASNRILTGKTYCEFVATTMTGTMMIGIGALSQSWVASNSPGVSTSALTFRNGGTVVCNNSTLATIQSFVAGNRIQLAFDPTQNPMQIWFNVNNGNWNNNASNDPATNVGGISCATMFGGGNSPLIVAYDATSGDVITASFTSFTYTPPSGFVSPDTVGATGYNADTNIAASFTSDGPARRDPVTGAAFRNAFPVATGGWYGGSRLYPQWSPAATGRTITGIVKESGVAVAGRTVRLHSVNGDFLAQAVSAGNGTFSFPNLNPAITYYVVAFDAGAGFNAQVFDQVSGL